MARTAHEKDISRTLVAAKDWIEDCLIGDGSILLGRERLWDSGFIGELIGAFVERPDHGTDSFTTKLVRQVGSASLDAKILTGEMLWALLLFPSNVSAATKRHQVNEMFHLAHRSTPLGSPFMADEVLAGIGSGGPGFNNYRDRELVFLITLAAELKKLDVARRRQILTDYDTFVAWIDTVPQEGRRQFRHMLRFFCFPDRVERISANNDRYKILEAFNIAPIKETRFWSDKQLDEAVLAVRVQFEKSVPKFDFYSPDVRARWSPEQRIKTSSGEEVTVAVPEDDESEEQVEQTEAIPHAVTRQSIQVQAKLAKIGAAMGFKIWVPRSDRQRVLDQLATEESVRSAFIDELPLGYDTTTLATIQQIDVLWVRGRSIGRAFEVEHTTAVYSGLLRMADLLALVPNMDVRLHIVAPDERREKVFHEMRRPVFTLLERGPLSKSCTFISYESVDAIASIPHLAHTNPTVVDEYAERADDL